MKSFNINTPRRKHIIKRTVCRFHTALASDMVKSPSTSSQVVSKVALKIREEMKALSSNQHDSILRPKYTVEALKYFEWERIWLELSANLPTLTSLLELIVKKNKPLICLISSQLLKCRHPQLGLAQRAVSIMLHAHGTQKQVSTKSTIIHINYFLHQVYSCLQPLNVCMSHKWTNKLVRKVSEDYDVDVQIWKDELKATIIIPPVSAHCTFHKLIK